jgi:hypothetical protein
MHAARAFDIAVARVERTLLSAAFDVDLDFDFLSQKTQRMPHPCAFCAQGWDTRMPAARAFDVDFDLVRNS